MMCIIKFPQNSDQQELWCWYQYYQITTYLPYSASSVFLCNEAFYRNLKELDLS